MKTFTYKVECIKGCTYTQKVEGINIDSHKPYCCGACGSREIAVWALIYDVITDIRRPDGTWVSLRGEA